MKLLHFTDIHEDTSKLEKIVNFLGGNKVDVVLNSGDLTGHCNNGNQDNNYELKLDKSIEEIDSKFNQKSYDLIKNEIDISFEEYSKLANNNGLNKIIQDLSNDKKENFKEIYLQNNFELENIMKEGFKNIYDDSLKKLKPYMDKISSKADHFINVGGNHDLKPIYDYFDGVTFLDNISEYKVESENTEFLFKGMVNSYESSDILGKIPPESRTDLLSIYENYISNKYGNEPYLTDMIFERVKEESDKEKERLKSYDADILVYHKNPNICGKKYSTNKLSKEYYENSGAKGVHSGHSHGGYIYKNDDGSFDFNPGIDHFFNIKYDKNKEVDKIEVYEYSQFD